MLAGHQVVLGGDLRRVSEPLGDRVGRVPLHPVGFAGGPEILSLEVVPVEGGQVMTALRIAVTSSRPRASAWV